MAKKAKIKAVATIIACQSLEQVQDFIRHIGDKNREVIRLQAKMNDEVAAITNGYTESINGLKQEIEQMTGAVEIWCAANRTKILEKGLKTANLITGEVSWRFSPPSVSLRKIEDVLASFKEKGLTQFIRVKEEVNKEAILADPLAVKDVAGVTIKSGQEFFEIKPFEDKIGALLADGGYSWAYAKGMAKKMYNKEDLRFCNGDELRGIVAALAYNKKRKT